MKLFLRFHLEKCNKAQVHINSFSNQPFIPKPKHDRKQRRPGHWTLGVSVMNVTSCHFCHFVLFWQQEHEASSPVRYSIASLVLYTNPSTYFIHKATSQYVPPSWNCGDHVIIMSLRFSWITLQCGNCAFRFIHRAEEINVRKSKWSF